MSDLEAAIAAEMKRQGCERYDFDSDIPEVSGETTCEQHEDVWDDDLDVCPVVAAAVRAGWDAAINAAAAKVTPTHKVEPVDPVTDPNFAATIGANRALWGASEHVRALLSEGGNRE